jgi:dienelactone hydrolase
MIQKKQIQYTCDGVNFDGFYAFNDSVKEKKPGILIVHDWTGVTDFNRSKAEKLAELGYVGFAVDMYGNGANGKTKEEKSALMKPLVEDRKLLLLRLQSALKAIRELPFVDPNRIAIMGYCFGGLCALDLARSGADILGAVSFHGNLSRPSFTGDETIRAKVLALHGADDPLVPKTQVSDFEKEMTAKKVDWQLYVYGGAMHSFTNPLANDPDFGTVYNAKADHRSWRAMKDFLTEIFTA